MVKTQNASVRLKEKKGIPDRFKLFLFVVPFILFAIYACYVPIWGWAYAFVQQKVGRSVFKMPFIGFKNFTTLMGTPLLRKQTVQAILNTFEFQGINFALSWLPMILAIFLSEVRSKKFQKAVQTAITLPYFVSWVIVYSLVLAMLSNSGVINVWLQRIGLKAINMLYTDKHVMVNMNILAYWKGIGWNSIVYFAAIAGIDQQMYEAAVLDGASRMQKIWYITIPNVLPTFVVLFIMAIGHFLGTGVDLFLLFSNGVNLTKIQTLDLYVYNLGIGSGKVSLAVCVGIATTFVGLVLFATANWVSKKIRGNSVF